MSSKGVTTKFTRWMIREEQKNKTRDQRTFNCGPKIRQKALDFQRLLQTKEIRGHSNAFRVDHITKEVELFDPLGPSEVLKFPILSNLYHYILETVVKRSGNTEIRTYRKYYPQFLCPFQK